MIMKKKTLTLIGVLIIPGIHLLIAILDYFGIRPTSKSTNLLYKIINFLFYKIDVPIAMIIFLLSIIIIFAFLYFKGRKKTYEPTKIDNKVEEIKKEKKKEEIKLTKEHLTVLYKLLQSKNTRCLRHILEDKYLNESQKTQADFNILRQELLDSDLILEKHSSYGAMWELTVPKGLEAAKKLHQDFKDVR